MNEYAMPRLLPFSVLLVLVAALWATPTRATGQVAQGDNRPRPLPEAITPPPELRRALAQGTRSANGAPGARYWQQWTDYALEATVVPAEHRLDGRGTIRYQNRSPDRLTELHLQLVQNFHAAGVIRMEPAEITGGIRLQRVTLNGRALQPDSAFGTGYLGLVGQAASGARYIVDGTNLTIVPPSPIEPGATADIQAEWSISLPQAGAGARMGYDRELTFLAYWYPQMSVYDDVVGWQTDPFLGTSEFYSGFGNYQLTVRAPAGWLVMATGDLLNADQVLEAGVLARFRQAVTSDSVVRVLSAGARATAASSGQVTWQFRADSVRDVVFLATRDTNWDALRTPVGDRNRDGRPDYTRIDAIWRASAPRWRNSARYAAHAIDFMSRYTGVSYPWPHMTAVEGGGIIGGGMEFPMTTLIGDYNQRGDTALYNVTVHELSHMWVPMIVANDERRYTWIDEGFTTFHENQGKKEFFPGLDWDLPDQESYVAIAAEELEGPMMRRSAYHYSGDAFNIASYEKPATVLAALKGVLGDEVFERARRTFLDRWKWKHPTPWDLWNTFEDVSGRDLDWFWHSWYFETWKLDQSIAEVRAAADGSAVVVVADEGMVPMPVDVVVTREGGATERYVIEVDVWLGGAREAQLVLRTGARVTRVEIDPERDYPDVDRQDNAWPR
jgi:hypothetical protein